MGKTRDQVSGQYGTKIVDIPIEQLVPADWNYKTDGTPEQIEKLKKSILRDRSAGVPAVREIETGVYEVIDGNHRLRALKELAWDTVRCESFGTISKAEAITIARRRNYLWFKDDPLRYAEIFSEIVVPEIPIDALAEFMPESKDQLEGIQKLLTFKWERFKTDEEEEDEGLLLKLRLPESLAKMWQEWRMRVEQSTGKPESDLKLFEYAVAEALASGITLVQETVENGTRNNARTHSTRKAHRKADRVDSGAPGTVGPQSP